MDITIASTTIEITPAIRTYAEKRLGSLKKYVHGIPTITADIGKTTTHHHHGDIFYTKGTVRVPLGQEYFATSEKADLYESIDDVRAELMRILTTDKKKHDSLWKKGARRIKGIMRGLR